MVRLKEIYVVGLGLEKTLLFRLIHRVQRAKLNQVDHGIRLKEVLELRLEVNQAERSREKKLSGKPA